MYELILAGKMLELYCSDFKIVPRFMFTEITGAFSRKSLVFRIYSQFIPGVPCIYHFLF